VCALAQDFLWEQDFPERNLLQRGGSNYHLEHLKIREKMLSGKSCSKEIRKIEVRLL
jgi:hypothetical protein